MKKAGLITSSMRVRREEGFVLPTALGLGAVVLVLSTTALILGSINQRNSVTALRISQAQYAAETGLEQAQFFLWNKAWAGLNPGTRAAYKFKLDQASYEGGRLGTSNAGNNVSFPNSGLDYALDNGATYTFKINRRVVTNVNNLNVAFDVTSTGKMPDGTVRILKQVFQVTPSTFGGLQYAILSNNINCIFCHTSVENMKALGGPAAATNPINRVKVGTLEQLSIDDTNSSNVHTSDTVIAGSLHVRGVVNGGITSNPTASTMKTLMLNKTDIIDSNTPKSFVTSNCTVLATCTPANATDKRSLYQNYPTKAQASNGQAWPDGELPDKFPPPIADDGAGAAPSKVSIANNKIIDDGEWDTQVNFSTTGLDDQNPAGSITGGVKSASSTLSGGLWPTTDDTSTVSSTTSSTVQNLVLDGSITPLTINGTVYVNGDVVIRGKIRGKGKIVARGNIYQMGNITYDCTGLNSRKAGSPDPSECDYTKNEPDSDLPQFGLLAGKNLMAGDFMTVRGQDFKSIARADETLELGSREAYLAPGTNAYQKLIPTGSRPSFTYREMAIFNRAELLKYQNDTTGSPRYKPRFYRLNASAPVVISSEEGGADAYNSDVYTEYFPETNKARVARQPAKDVNGNDISSGNPTQNLPGAIRDSNSADIQGGTGLLVNDVLNVIKDSNKSLNMPLISNWSAGNLKKAWINAQECASCPKGALRTDALLYSANSVFSVARVRPAGGFNLDTVSSANVSNANGSWDLRGSLIAADLGALVTGQNNDNLLTGAWATGVQTSTNRGLSVYYDERMKSFFGQSDGSAQLVRNNWLITDKEIR